MAKRQFLTLLGVCVTVLVAGCASEPEMTLQQRALKISRGMSKGQVVDILGSPGSRSFQGNLEVMQFCETAFRADKYVTIYMKENIVQSMTNSETGYGDGLCFQRFEPVDWSKFK